MPPKHLSGIQKQKKRKIEEDLRMSQADALHKVFQKQPQSCNVDEEDATANVEDNVDANVEDDVGANIEEVVEVNQIDIFDPRIWDALNPNMINVLVEKGPKRDLTIDKGPKDQFGRRFSPTLYTRTLPNLETCDREWLVYSKELDKVFCFCCKLFGKGLEKDGLDNEGYGDWQHATSKLKKHEVGFEHLKNMAKWVEMRRRLKVSETIDKVASEQLKKERDYWIQVILRIISLVKYLSKHNLTFYGKNKKLYQESNGNFLGAIEMLEEFDPIIKEHVRHIISDELHVHYPGHNIQNEIIQLLGQEIKLQIVKKVKEAKYYSIILDCTPDIYHQEHMSLIVRYVNFNSNSVTVDESFLGFLNIDDTIGKGLFDTIIEELESLGFDIDDIRGQGYDNGSNMKGRHHGVQRRFLDKNHRAFYTPCGCHSLNLVLCDMANTCTKVRNLFGVIQRIYTIFADSTKRCQILKDNIEGLTLKSLSTTRWESRVDCVKAIRFQFLDLREALLEVAEKDNDAKIKSQAKSLAKNELGDFEFLVSIIIWFEILNTVNVVSKKLQSKDMLLDVAIREVNDLIKFFKDFRETGLSMAIDEARAIAIEMGIDPVFSQRRPVRRRKHFDETSTEQEISFSPEENFEVNYFLSIVDQTIASLQTRFEQYKDLEKVFGFLFPRRLKELEDKDLKSYCFALQDALKHGETSDLDANELYLELRLFKTSLPSEIINPIDALKYLKRVDCFPNALIAYRVLLTIPVTMASAEQSFSKLKLLKSYLRSTLSQERLNGLAMMTIENEILETMEYEDLINKFALEKARRASRFT